MQDLSGAYLEFNNYLNLKYLISTKKFNGLVGHYQCDHGSVWDTWGAVRDGLISRIPNVTCASEREHGQKKWPCDLVWPSEDRWLPWTMVR